MEPLGAQVTVRYSFRDPDGAEGPWIPLREPLALGAAVGEEREYRVLVRADSADGELERRELWVRIDKRPPLPPRIQPEAGVSWDPVTVTFEKAAGDKVFYAVNGDVVGSAVPWDGRPLSIGTPETRSDFVVQAYSVDVAGNRSPIVTSHYVVDARAALLDVLSPVAGTFANPQAVILSFRNMRWVRYTLDGSDPANGTPYMGPVLVKKLGETTVRIAAQPRSARRSLVRRDVTVTYAPEKGNGFRLSAESGAYPQGVSPEVVTAPEGSLYYTLWEKTPVESDFLAGAAIALPGNDGTPRGVTLRLRALSRSGSWGAECRYYYVIGQKGPSAPLIMLSGGEPVRSTARVQVIAPEDSLLSVTMDGSRPSLMAPGPVDAYEVKPGGGSFVVKAVAIDGSGTESRLVERRIATDAAQGAVPVIRAAASPRTGTVVFSGAAAAGGLVYELSSDGSDPPAPVAGSPRLDLPLTVTLPFGVQRTFKLRAGTLDEAGRVVAVADVVTATLNRKPPPRPLLSPAPSNTALDVPVSLAISSLGRVFSTMSADGSTPPDPRAELASGGTSVALPGSDGSLVTYKVKVLAVDGDGNASEVYGPYTYAVDLRPPRLPAIGGIADGGRYNARRISSNVGDSPWNVRYTVSTDGNAPPDPDAKSPVLTHDVVFAGDEGRVVSFTVKLLAISHDGTRLGERRQLSFVIDLKPPEVPQVTGAPASGRVAKPVVLTAEPVPGDVRLFYSVASGDDDPPDPVKEGQRYVDPLSFDAPEGERRAVAVRFATIDDAGNRSLYDRRLRFMIDRELPDDPMVSGAPAGGISDRPVILSLGAATSLIVFELTDDGSIPRLPTASSSPYGSPLLLTGNAGLSVTYRLIARAVNDLGIASRAASMVTVIVDRTMPPAPEHPRLQYVPENPQVAYLSWESMPQGRLLYRLLSQSGPTPDFQPYVGPVAVAVSPTEGSTIRGEAAIENRAGTRGPSISFALSIARRLAAPVVRGARDGGIYAGKVVLGIDPSQGETRYEIATDGGFPPEVTPSSPLAKGQIVVDAVDGETIDARVALRAFDPSGKLAPSDETRIGFTVDRTPPDPPVAVGIEDGDWFEDGRTVSLLSAEGTIYYGVTTGQETSIPAQTEANKYKGDLRLEAVPGQSVTYRIVAFTVDSAGNRSREIRAWSVTVDQMIVYASPSGNDYADGTRGAPVRSVKRALEIAGSTSRKTIYAATGEYPSDAELTVSTNVTIVGGLDPHTWTPLGLERWSTLTAVGPWRGGTSLLSVSGGAVTLRGVKLVDGTGALASVVSVWSGSLAVESSELGMGGTARQCGFVLNGGVLSITASALHADGVSSGSLVSAAGGKLSITGSRLAGPASGSDFACIDLAGVAGVELRGVTVSAGGGQRTRAVRAKSSELSVGGSRLGSGSGSVDAIALEAVGSKVSLDNVTLTAAAGAQSPVALLAAGSTVVASHVNVEVAGASSAVGISARGGSLSVARSVLAGTSAPEYLVLVRTENCAAVITNSMVMGGDARQTFCVISRDGSLDLFNNTILGGTGVTLASAVAVQGSTVARIINNIIAREKGTQGTALEFLSAGSLPFAAGPGGLLLTNSFAGWNRLLRVEPASVPGAAKDVVGVGDLNAFDGDVFGGTVNGNIAEDTAMSFTGPGVYRLRRDSRCVDGGTDLVALEGAAAMPISADYDGNPRPARQQLVTPGPARGWDIGAREYSD